MLKLVDANSKSAGRQDMREAIFSIVDFYETLQLCIDVQKCDRPLALSYFQEYARRFYCLYAPYIGKLRHQQSMPGYATRLERLALAGGSCEGK